MSFIKQQVKKEHPINDMSDYQGLFGLVAITPEHNSSIENVSIENSVIFGRDFVGGVAGALSKQAEIKDTDTREEEQMAVAQVLNVVVQEPVVHLSYDESDDEKTEESLPVKPVNPAPEPVIPDVPVPTPSPTTPLASALSNANIEENTIIVSNVDGVALSYAPEFSLTMNNCRFNGYVIGKHYAQGSAVDGKGAVQNGLGNKRSWQFYLEG